MKLCPGLKISVSRFHWKIFKNTIASLREIEIEDVEKTPEFKKKERQYRTNQSQRKRDKEVAELARSEEAAKVAKDLVAKVTQDKKDE